MSIKSRALLGPRLHLKSQFTSLPGPGKNFVTIQGPGPSPDSKKNVVLLLISFLIIG